MSNHHGHHRSSHHSRSRMHHSSSSSHYQSLQSRSRTSSSNMNNTSSGTSRGQQSHAQESRDSGSDWSEHRSSSGKVYYYNARTGLSQWEIPAELRPPQRQVSPESEISESSSIRQQQDNSPSSGASSNNSTQSECVPEDKPLLTPSLAQYFKPELIVNFNSSHIEELERQANQYARDALMLSERILKETVDLKIAKAVVHYVEISLEAQEKKYSLLRNTINTFGFVQ